MNTKHSSPLHLTNPTLSQRVLQNYATNMTHGFSSLRHDTRSVGCNWADTPCNNDILKINVFHILGANESLSLLERIEIILSYACFVSVSILCKNRTLQVLLLQEVTTVPHLATKNRLDPVKKGFNCLSVQKTRFEIASVNSILLTRTHFTKYGSIRLHRSIHKLTPFSQAETTERRLLRSLRTPLASSTFIHL